MLEAPEAQKLALSSAGGEVATPKRSFSLGPAKSSSVPDTLSQRVTPREGTSFSGPKADLKNMLVWKETSLGDVARSMFPQKICKEFDPGAGSFDRPAEVPPVAGPFGRAGEGEESSVSSHRRASPVPPVLPKPLSKRICRLRPANEAHLVPRANMAPPMGVSDERLSALGRMAQEKDAVLEWYDVPSVSSLSSPEPKDTPVEAFGAREKMSWLLRGPDGQPRPGGWQASPYVTEDEVEFEWQMADVPQPKPQYARDGTPLTDRSKAFWAANYRARLGREGLWPPRWDHFGQDPRTAEERLRWGEAGPPTLATLEAPPEYSPPKPEANQDLVKERAESFLSDAKAAFDKGVWQTDASLHAREKKVDAEAIRGGTTVLEAKPGRRTLRLAYFFAGVKRKASVAEELRKLCEKDGHGLQVYEVDVLIGGSEHDLLDKETQESWLGRLEAGEFDCVLLSPPCGTWSRANWANGDGPKPCRNRRHPWGIPYARAGAQRRAASGNEFIHFSIRAITAAKTAKGKGRLVRCILEHPEDLGRMERGEPASIWQLPEIRSAFGDLPCVSVAGHQCQFPGVDRKKPTRLYSDILSIGDFGFIGWPRFDSRGYYLGPLPRACGHSRHKQRTIGRNRKGGFNTSPFAAYPPGMCIFLALRIFKDFVDRHKSSDGGGEDHARRTLRLMANTAKARRASIFGKSTRRTRISPTGRSPEWVVGRDARSPEQSEDQERMHVHPSDLSRDDPQRDVDVQVCSEAIDERGIHRPIKDGLEDDGIENVLAEDEDHRLPGQNTCEDTSDEEPEMPGIVRPPRGSGWWGIGRPLQPHKKGVNKDFVDGAGILSPGRWRVRDRRLPESEVAQELRDTLREALQDMDSRLAGGSARAALALMMSGNLERIPFPEADVEVLRGILKDVLEEYGYGRGDKVEGDADQVTDTRLVEALLEAFGDPDAYFCRWWSRGVWLGSPWRPLPRTPAVFDRKVKWCVLESPLKGFCETSRKFGLGLLRSHGARRHRVSSRKLSRKQWRKQTARGICSLFCDIRLVHISAFRDTKAHACTHPRTGKQAQTQIALILSFVLPHAQSKVCFSLSRTQAHSHTHTCTHTHTLTHTLRAV